ncbi:MAG: AtpZ/AtpI family protein [Hyphomicrobiaceae bacterium]|nr:ATP F0F1 synthase subunit I [Hyphomicrobiaceae bacterium]
MSNDSKKGDRELGEMSPEDREAIRKRAAELGHKLETAKHRHERPRASSNQGNAMAKGMRAATELIGGVVAGAGLGWVLDKWLGTTPGLFILGFLLGSAAGMLNIIRMAQREKTPPAPSVRDDQDDDK